MAEQKRDYYEVLGIDKNADDAAIKKAYRVLAKKYHPDMNPGNAEAEKKFKEASEAYAILSDPEKKKQYDQFGHAAFEGGSGGFGGFDFNTADFSDIFGDIFGDFFGGGRRGRGNNGPMKGANIRTSVRITFEEAVLVLKKKLNLPLRMSVRLVMAAGQSRAPIRKPARSAAVKARWYLPSSLSLERSEMYRLVRIVMVQVR